MVEPPGPRPQAEAYVYSVSALNAEVRDLLESVLPRVWVEGELSNLSRPASGHWYFSLKDAGAQVRCAMFRNHNRQVAVTPVAGMQVLVRAAVSLYPARGDYQLIVDHLEEAGEGALRRAFEALKRRLAAGGLFDGAAKRPVPSLPGRIGVITSPTGAAVRDILSVLARRFPAVPVRIYPVPVQGDAAAGAIAAALDRASARGDCDVLILARGGGSLEDLQPFNDEGVARAIRRCGVPVITGVGHEVDLTIADLAADLRAETPSAAAAAAVPDGPALALTLGRLDARLRAALRRRLHHQGQRLEWLARRLRHPRQSLRERQQRLDGLHLRLEAALTRALEARARRLERAHTRLTALSPRARTVLSRQRLNDLAGRLLRAWQGALDRRRGQLCGLSRALDTVSPLATLERGYAIVTRAVDGRVLRDATTVRPGEAIAIRLHRGRLRGTVDGIDGAEEPTP